MEDNYSTKLKLNALNDTNLGTFNIKALCARRRQIMLK